ncbi:MAG: BrnT family toxin [Azoarcus sp.]|jgi:uncharacterized DUF497 family protein|nr:BrnT family toxin [Azoarcus sp.]
MDIEFDPRKDRENIRRHSGLSLALAEILDWDSAFTVEDERYFYDEMRMNSIVPGGDTLYFVTFTYRDDRMRIISLRHADNAEKRHYVESIY